MSVLVAKIKCIFLWAWKFGQLILGHTDSFQSTNKPATLPQHLRKFPSSKIMRSEMSVTLNISLVCDMTPLCFVGIFRIF
jgi:hypothetical protein